MHPRRSAARAAGVTKSTIYRAIKTGRLPASKLNGGGYAIYPAELLRAFPSQGMIVKRKRPYATKKERNGAGEIALGLHPAAKR
jgi:excisionase family DNA binding protein